MKPEKILQHLKSIANPKDKEGMARFGIKPDKALGIRIPVLRELAKDIGIDHSLAQKLWDSEFHEARILTGMIADINQTDSKLMDKWVKDFDSWDICDEMMLNLFFKSTIAYKKAVQWSKSKPEFEKRAGFALMAVLAFKDKNADDEQFNAFIKPIFENADDERNFVKKAVNWAIRQIGKRNQSLNTKFIQVAEKLALKGSKPAKWIAADALRELKSDAVQKRLMKK